MGLLSCLSMVAVILTATSEASNLTPQAFGSNLNVLPAAFGDFNSDASTDIFVLSMDQKSVSVLLAYNIEPLFRAQSNLMCTFPSEITSVVPGDFNGDVFMDIMVTTRNQTGNKRNTNVHILWGGMVEGRKVLNCSQANNPFFQVRGEPVALDYNQDMIIDLFGMDTNEKRTFWLFNRNQTLPQAIPMENVENQKIRYPHSNSYLDLNNDYMPDLVITTDENFEVWYGKKSEDHGFEFSHNIEMPKNYKRRGQSLYLDLELTGKFDPILPVCVDRDCQNSTILVYYEDTWVSLPINFRDSKTTLWGFPQQTGQYLDTITLRGGDFNMDGYPDLLATLESGSDHTTRTFLLQNVPCTVCEKFGRTFEIKWDALTPFTKNETVMGAFYDFYQDGILDVIFVEKRSGVLNVAAFKNSLDYDANFVKVMVLTGLTNKDYPILPGTLGIKKQTYGTNLPGPSISYKTTTQDGDSRNAIAAQLPQSAHFSLNLPFTTFGLGRTPNFIDSLTIGVGGKHREYPQIIPNSQVVIIPNPIDDASRWKAQLFVTPSKLILQSAVALATTCIFIMFIILALYWKERREDKIEKLQEAHRFHFDAM